MTTDEHLNRIVAKCRELLAVDAGSDRAKADWRATIAKCKFIQAYRKIRFGYDGDCGTTRLVDELESRLTAAWPEELL